MTRIHRRRDDPRTVPNRKLFYKLARALVESYPHRVKEVREGIISSKAEDPEPHTSYWVMTTGGLLHITVYDDWVHTKFEWPKEAKAAGCWAFTQTGGDANPHSGKWNFHWSSGSPEDNIALIKWAFGKVLKTGPEVEAELAMAISRHNAEKVQWYKDRGLEPPEALA